MDGNLAIAFVALPLFATDQLGASAFELGIIGAIGAVTYVLAAPLGSHIAPRFGRRRFILASGIGFAITYLLVAHSTQVWHLFILSGCSGISCALFYPLVEGEIGAGATGRVLRRRVGYFCLAWSTGSTIGFLVGGRLYDLGVSLPFISCAFGGLTVAIITYFFIPSAFKLGPGGTGGQGLGMREAAGRAAAPHSAQPKAPDAFLTPGVFLWLAYIANFCAWGLFSIHRHLYAQPALLRFGYSGTQLGILIGGLCLTRTLIFFILQRWEGWHYKKRPFFLLQLVMFGGATVIVLSGNFLLTLCAFMLTGLGAGMTYYSSILYSLDDPRTEGKRAGFHEAILGAGGALSMAAAGRMPALTGRMMSPFAFGAALVAAGLLIQTTLSLKARKDNRV
jgi:hypothetical protein